ncbi:unnamed protein product [Nyctereutes procyonoides]|uniref:(raccoon dog) hypothetical protein n=1 Tax=Nyctereutes procyonoides TaxID=34880 RepID=A0A811Z042_NYCPR|nr:unnamed protein product [Nyctereutes procyonoides]
MEGEGFLLSIIIYKTKYISYFAAGTPVIGYLAYKRFYGKDHHNKSMVNLHMQKDNPKIIHAYDMEDLGDKFPLCDGSRTKHNEETGDNVRPLIIKKKET